MAKLNIKVVDMD
jgi:hypothetical protein